MTDRNEQDPDEASPRLDLVWGCAAIAAEIRRSNRQTFHMLEAGLLPAKKIGNRWVGDRGKLRALFLEVAA